jgi:hypothetical protein
MAIRKLGRLSVQLAAALALAGLVPLAHSAAARAASAQYSFTADAFGTSATVKAGSLGAGSGRSAFVILSCTTRPQTDTNSAAAVSIPELQTSTGNVTDTVSSSVNTSTGTYSDSASSTVNGISALGGLIKASAATASASASQAPSGPAASGSVTLSGLTIGGNGISAHPAPNTKLPLSGIGSVTLNAQKVIKTNSRALMNLDAIVVTFATGNTLGVPAGATLIIGHTLATVGGPVSGLLSGRSFGTSLTGGTVTSGPSFIAYVNCTGTGGKTITNQGSSVSAGPLSTGAVTDTAEGTDTAAQLSARTTSNVDAVQVSQVLSVARVSTNASASVANGTVQRSGGTTIAGLTVLGVPITLPVNIPPNYHVPLLGGTLILNRQLTGTHGLLVDGLYLTYPGVGTVTIASSSAYA